jgi:hypothetical protein
VKTKTILILVLIIALIAVYYIVVTGYLKERQAHDSLVSEIASTKQTLEQVPQPPAGLEEKLDTARADLDSARNAFPADMNSTNLVDTILLLADEIGIKAIPLITQAWTTENLYGYSYSVFRLNISATGNFNQLVEFSGSLENGEIETLVLEYLSVERDDETEDPPEGEIPVKASIDIAIFSQAPDAEEDSEGES